MNFSGFIGRLVRIDLISTNKYFYHGKVLEADDKFLKMIEEKGRTIILAVREIRNIREDVR